MKTFLTLITLIFSFGLKAERVTIEANDGFALIGNYQAGAKSAGVLMLHQCNADKSMYEQLVKKNQSIGIHSLALDFRGYGESTNEKFDREKMEKDAANRNEFVTKIRKMRSDHWQSDVVAAYQFLRSKVGSDNISFIGASCGGVQSIYLAEKFKPKSFTFFSSGMNDEIVEKFAKLSEVPALIIAAQGDRYTYNSSKTIFEQAKSESSRLKLYKGNGHGWPLFDVDKKLSQEMRDWFEHTLQ